MPLGDANPLIFTTQHEKRSSGIWGHQTAASAAPPLDRRSHWRRSTV